MKIVAWFSGLLAAADPAPLPPNPAQPPVVLVHGIHATGKDMTRLAKALRATGREVFAPTLLPNDGSVSIGELSAQLEKYIADQGVRRPFDLVGYSMGGIVTRHYLQRRGGLDHVRRYISLSAPHHGTLVALLNGGPGGREMRRGSAFLDDLNGDAEMLSRAGFTSFWTRTDLIILPARSSLMPAAENVHLLGLGHFSFIIERRCIRRVVDELNRGLASP